MGEHISSDLKEKIIEMFQNKVKQVDICRNLNLRKQTVNSIICRFKKDKAVFNRKRGGRKRKTSESKKSDNVCKTNSCQKHAVECIMEDSSATVIREGTSMKKNDEEAVT